MIYNYMISIVTDNEDSQSIVEDAARMIAEECGWSGHDMVTIEAVALNEDDDPRLFANRLGINPHFISQYELVP